MLKGIIKNRPVNLCAVYLEPGRIEVLHARRHWRSWDIGAAEQFNVPAEETVFDHLQHLSIKPKGRKGSALLVIVSSVFYSVHSENYPLSLKDNLDESINYDWQENIFQEYERTLHFSGPPMALDQHVSVPIFSIPREVYDKLYQTLNGILFDTFAVAPSALWFATLLPPAGETDGDSEIVARRLDDDNLEVHRFNRGVFLETALVGSSSQSLKLFGENLKCMGSGESEPRVHLVCAPGERKLSDPAEKWRQAGIPIEVLEITKPFISRWLPGMLQQDVIHTFDSEILLKPWQIPRIAAPLGALVLIFALYGIYQSYSADSMAQASKRLKVQINQLQSRWKPTEELQTRITKFQEDQKTLSEFNREDYKLLELLNFLTQLTPEDTSLNYLSLRKGQLILRGESKSALKYLAELSKTEGLTDVKFASPVTRDPGTDQERFNVQLQIDMEKLKKSFDALPPEPPLAPSNAGPAPETSAAVKKNSEGRPAEGEPGFNAVIDQGRAVDEQSPEEGRQ